MNLLLFVNETCPPCEQALHEIDFYFEKITQETSIKEYTVLDFNKDLEEVDKYNIWEQPCFIVIDDEANELLRHIGPIKNIDFFIKKINEL